MPRAVARPAPPTRHFEDRDMPALLELMARIAPTGAPPTEDEFRAAFYSPNDGRDPRRDIFIKPGPAADADGFVALYREDDFFTALGPFLAPDLSVRHRPCAHALLKSAEVEAHRRGWRSLRFEVDGADHERRILLHNRGYREVRTFNRMELSLGVDWGALSDADVLRPPDTNRGKVITLEQYCQRTGARPAVVLGTLLDEVLGDKWMYQAHGERGAAERLERAAAGAERVLLGLERTNGEPVAFFEWHREAPTRAFLDDIGVCKKARRQGWGRRMMREGLAAMEAEGALTTLLDVDRENQAARWLYRRLGFVETGTVRYLALRLH